MEPRDRQFFRSLGPSQQQWVHFLTEWVGGLELCMISHHILKCNKREWQQHCYLPKDECCNKDCNSSEWKHLQLGNTYLEPMGGFARAHLRWPWWIDDVR